MESEELTEKPVKTLLVGEKAWEREKALEEIQGRRDHLNKCVRKDRIYTYKAPISTEMVHSVFCG